MLRFPVISAVFLFLVLGLTCAFDILSPLHTGLTYSKNAIGRTIDTVTDTLRLSNVKNISENVTSNLTDAAADLAKQKYNSSVNCFGLGNTVARSIEYLFQAKPNGSDALDIKFTLSSKRQPKRVYIVSGDQFGMEWTDFDITRTMIIIVHGFLASGNETWIHDMEKAFHKWGDVNVLVVDWSEGGNTLNYLKAAVNTKVAGYKIAKVLEEIANYTRERSSIPEDQWGLVHCIGHSLGAHICGVAANEVKHINLEWPILRITGLDPAQPCFQVTDNALKLDKEDAPFVDIIHTNARLLWKFGLGLPNRMGHMDFYPNGGRLQPGCALTYSSLTDILKIPIAAISEAICNHGRSYIYFTESVLSAVERNCSFDSSLWNCTLKDAERILLEKRCTAGVDKDCVEMGINSINYPQRGAFFTVTSATPSYCNPDENDKEEVRTALKEELG